MYITIAVIAFVLFVGLALVFDDRSIKFRILGKSKSSEADDVEDSSRSKKRFELETASDSIDTARYRANKILTKTAQKHVDSSSKTKVPIHINQAVQESMQEEMEPLPDPFDTKEE